LNKVASAAEPVELSAWAGKACAPLSTIIFVLLAVLPDAPVFSVAVWRALTFVNVDKGSRSGTWIGSRSFRG
jgi:hypothetical protein